MDEDGTRGSGGNEISGEHDTKGWGAFGRNMSQAIGQAVQHPIQTAQAIGGRPVL